MRRIHSAQAAEKQSKMEKAKQLTAEALQKQQNMKIQKNAEAPSKTGDINDLFMASSVKNTAVQGKNTRVHGSLSLPLSIFLFFYFHFWPKLSYHHYHHLLLLPISPLKRPRANPEISFYLSSV